MYFWKLFLLSCNCSYEWKGLFCTERTTICDLEPSCVEGSTCLPRVPGGYECLCPLGKAGENCSEGEACQNQTKWPVCPAKKISLGICSVWSVFPVRLKKVWALTTQQKTQIRMGRWVHRSFCWFCCTPAHFIYVQFTFHLPKVYKSFENATFICIKKYLNWHCF